MTGESRPLMPLLTTTMGMEPGIGNVTQSKWDSGTLLPSHGDMEVRASTEYQNRHLVYLIAHRIVDLIIINKRVESTYKHRRPQGLIFAAWSISVFTMLTASSKVTK